LRAPDTPLSPLNSHQHAGPAVSPPIRVVNPPIDALHEVMRWIQEETRAILPPMVTAPTRVLHAPVEIAGQDDALDVRPIECRLVDV